MSAETNRPITPQDCVTIRDIAADDTSWLSTIKISPNGKQVAYLVKSPNLQTNINEIGLYVLPLPQGNGDHLKPTLVGDISGARWTEDSRHMVLLLRDATGRRAIHIVDVSTGQHGTFVKADTDIVEYSMDAGGDTVVYATEVPDTEGISGPHTQRVTAQGYRIAFPQTTEAAWPRRKVFITRRQRNHWSAPEEISIKSPLNGRLISLFNHAMNSGLNLSIAPDGSAVLLSYFDLSDEMPVSWRESAFVMLRDRSGITQALVPLVLYNLRTRTSSMPLATPWATSTPLWSSDSKSFLVAAMAPVGSQLEKDDLANHTLGHVSQSRLFAVSLCCAQVEVVASHLAFAWEGALYWAKSGEVSLRSTAMNRIEEAKQRDGIWREASSIQLPFKGDLRVATNGHYVIGNFSDSDVPPELFSYQPQTGESHILVHLDPQLSSLTFARSKEVRWKTSTGYDATGILLLPPDYTEGKRYPLVIQTKPFSRGFTCSFGSFPSFAPQPIATAGILYLGEVATEGSSQKEEEFYPQGYPGPRTVGSLAEAAFNMDLWDSAIRTLDGLGLVDRSRVGIIGFSRTGWYTEFILAHSLFHYRAATVADNVQYSVGEYWLHHDPDTIGEYNHLYGGPPLGMTVKNWEDFSVSFSMDKVHTPLLMEEMGGGKPYDDENVIPINLASAFEVFTGLNVLGRPVELFYYPNEDHAPDHPSARLATLERNVDWYRFWLQGYERPNPEDSDQYKRWEHLRELHDADQKAAGLTDGDSRTSKAPH
jgi:dipeptidyl aminopeptidase/acylaminoacyl peptidase